MGHRKKCSDEVLIELKGAFQSSSSLESCLKISEDNPLREHYSSFKQSQKHLLKVMYKAILQLAHLPLFTAYLSWVEEMRPVEPDICNYAYLLVNEKFLFFTDENNNFLTISSMRYFDHKEIINKIRCKRDFSLELREKLVSTYLSFTQWLEDRTYDHVSRAFDPDEMKRQGKAIHYFMFIRLLGHLDDKMQLIAKLLYFGGSRTLDEVLSLDLEDVDYQDRIIRFKSQLISYPEQGA